MEPTNNKSSRDTHAASFRAVCGRVSGASSDLFISSAERSAMPESLSHFVESVVGHVNFDPISVDLLSSLRATKVPFSLISLALGTLPANSIMSFRDLGELNNAVADLEALRVLLGQLDSPEFAIWCGAHGSLARDHLVEAISDINKTLEFVRRKSSSVTVGCSLDDLSLTRTDISQSGILGLRVDLVILRGLKNAKPKKVKRAIKQLTRAGAGAVVPSTKKDLSRVTRRHGDLRGKVLGKGKLTEVTPTQFRYAHPLRNADKLDLQIGLLDNTLVIELAGITRLIALPAACSRMTAQAAHLTAHSISIDFSVMEDQWPTR